MDSFDKQWQRWFPNDRNVRATQSSGGGHNTRIVMAIAGIVALFIVLSISKRFYTEWLWFGSLGYDSVYNTILRTRVLLFFLAAIVFGIFFSGNLILATRVTKATETSFLPWAIVSRVQSWLRVSVFTSTALLSLIFGLVAQSKWEAVLRFFNGQPFGYTDPIFDKEISFYVFSLPFFHLLLGWLLAALIFTLLGSAGVYLLSHAVRRLRLDFTRPVLAHLGGLVIAILGIFAWNYRLSIWELVFSERGVIFGAGYADMHATLPALWILLATVLVLMVVVLISIAKRKPYWPIYGIGVWIAVAVIVGAGYPNLVQRFQVEANELVREKPYIENNIDFTRQAYALDMVEEQSFLAEESPSPADITRNQVTINNIRLWDPRPLKDTYNQIQSIRLYYDFNDVDVDRYVIDGDYRQVMLSARELSAEKLAGEAQTWVIRRLQFTHGYGIALSPVNEITTQGLPNLLVKDIPPAGSFNIEHPQIYYGEKTNDYVIVKTMTEEFDYPRGDDNVYGSYQGGAGVGVGSFIRRLVYAWQFGDFNILISDELTARSQILYHRNIKERVSLLAPFLKLDRDPYLVVLDGRLLWIQDAYTVSDQYPYSQPVGDLNYIRNSVKVVVDAYDGSVTFYVTDPDDALVRTYQTIFPELFVPAEQIPPGLSAHWRYPEDMFTIQASVYQSYHMRDARVFYNKEDLWAVPKEFYAGSEQAVEPYYIIMRLPDEMKEEFMLMLPFTPVNKNNTIGWLAGRSDGENYGKLIAYLFPKERLVYGPNQIENRIQQDTSITDQFALWGRGGSKVIRGNLLLIPLGESMIYVEPVFLQAETGGLPEIKRVIVAAGDRIAMEPTLGESIASVFGIETPPAESEPPTLPKTWGPVAAAAANLIEQAQEHYDQAQQYLKEGDWAGYGRELDSLGLILEQLAQLVIID